MIMFVLRLETLKKAIQDRMKKEFSVILLMIIKNLKISFQEY